MATTTQMTGFQRELRAAVRNADGRTNVGKHIATVASLLLEHDTLAEQVFDMCGTVGFDEATLRRVRNEGYEEGLDEGTNDALAHHGFDEGYREALDDIRSLQPTSEEDTSNGSL